MTDSFRRDIRALGVIALVLLVLLWPVTFGGKLLLPADMLMVMQPWKAHAQELGFRRVHTPFLDAIQQHYPWRKYAAEQLRRNTIPLWNPYMFSGAPFVANNQSAVFYPETWLFALMPPERAFGWAALLSLLMGGTFMFYFLRALGLSRRATLAGVVPFLLSGFMVGWMLLPTIRAVPMWLPLMLLAVERLAGACPSIVRAASSRESTRVGASVPRRASAGLSPDPHGSDGGRGPRQAVRLPDTPPLRDGEPAANGPLRTAQPATWTAVLAFATGMQFLAGHLHVSVFVLLIVAAYALFRVVQRLLQRDWLAACSLAGCSLGGVVIGTGLAMLQLLPVLELVGMNPRQGGMDFAAIRGMGMVPAYLLAALMPDLFGNPVDYNFWGYTLFSSNREYVETAWYFGVPALLLMVAAVAWRRPRPAQTWFWTGLFLGGLGIAWATGLYYVLYLLLPPLRQLPGVSRGVFVCCFAGSVLAAHGLQALLDQLHAGEGERVRRVLDTTAVTLALIAIAGGVGVWLYSGRMEDALPGIGGYTLAQLLRCLGILLATIVALLVMTSRRLPSRNDQAPIYRLRPGLVLLLIVISADLLYFAGHFLPKVSPAVLHVQTKALEVLRQDHSVYRMTSLTGNERGIDRMPPNLTMAFGFQDVQGSDSLIFQGYWDLWGIIPKDTKANPMADSPVLDLLNCKYLLTSVDLKETPGWRQLRAETEVPVWENAEVLPRAYVAGKTVTLPPEQVLARMQQADFDPHRLTLVSGAEASAGSGEAAVAIERYESNHVALAGKLPASRLTVLSDIWYPGWKVFADGVEIPLLRANYILRGVVPARDASRLEFVYLPASFTVGAFITFVCVMLIACGFVLGRRR